MLELLVSFGPHHWQKTHKQYSPPQNLALAVVLHLDPVSAAKKGSNGSTCFHRWLGQENLIAIIVIVRPWLGKISLHRTLHRIIKVGMMHCAVNLKELTRQGLYAMALVAMWPSAMLL